MTCPPDDANPGPEPESPPPPAIDEPVRAAILQQCAAAGPDSSVDFSAIARALGGSPTEVVPWRALIRRVRAEATALQAAGRIVVLRKGKPVDMQSAKGVIRLALPAGEGS